MSRYQTTSAVPPGARQDLRSVWCDNSWDPQGFPFRHPPKRWENGTFHWDPKAIIPSFNGFDIKSPNPGNRSCDGKGTSLIQVVSPDFWWCKSWQLKHFSTTSPYKALDFWFTSSLHLSNPLFWSSFLQQMSPKTEPWTAMAMAAMGHSLGASAGELERSSESSR